MITKLNLSFCREIIWTRTSAIKNAISADATDVCAPIRQLSTRIAASGTNTTSASSSLTVHLINNLTRAAGILRIST